MSEVRCFGWGDPLYTAYHDEEWGRPVRDERSVYERLCLEGFQSGLSWLTILRKRESVPCARSPVSTPSVVARVHERRTSNGCSPTPRSSVTAARSKRRSRMRTRPWRCARQANPLHELLWLHAPAARPAPRSHADWLSSTTESEELAKVLRRAGFRFIGPTTVHAAMQACGVVNDHLANCVVRKDVEAVRSSFDHSYPS